VATRVRGSLEVDLNGVRFPTPILGASGCFGSGVEMTEAIDLRRVGGIITKSVTLKPRRGNPTPRMAETPSGMLNSIGLQNPGIEGFIAKDAVFLQRVPVPVVVSIAGKSVEEYVTVTRRVNELPNIAAIEANISCPNVERRNQVFACHPDQAAEVVGAVSRMSSLPVFAKLTPDVTDIVEVADACVRAGAHGISLINTLLGMAIDVDTGRPRLGSSMGGLSGPAIRPVAVRAVYQVAQAMPDVPIIGMGGVTSGRDAAELIMAGAWAVAVGTANFWNPHATIEIAQQLAEILASKAMRSPAELRGKVIGGNPSTESAHRGG
jgi:dihydroorotate dehydrogenase (NAD+) catalytic subunit